MGCAVVLDHELLVGIEEVRAGDEGIAERDLHAWARQTRKHKDHAKARFHRALGRGFGELCQLSSELIESKQPLMQGFIGSDDCLNEGQPPLEVLQGPNNRGRSESFAENDVI